LLMFTSRNCLSLRRALILTVFALTLATPPPGAYAFTLLAPKGQKALLEYAIDIKGNASGTNNNYQSQQWSTSRSLVVRATLIAQKPSIQDPGDLGGPDRAASPPNSEAFRPSPEMAAFMTKLEKCGEDMSCRMRVTQEMRQDPKVKDDIQMLTKAGEVLKKGSPRYQIWFVDRKTPAAGKVKMEVQRDQLFKTAVDERETCRETADLRFEDLMRTWPATIKIDAQAGTYAVNFGGVGNTFTTNIDCVRLDGRKRSEQHTTSGRKFLPEKYQKGAPYEIQVFRGRPEAAPGAGWLAQDKKVLIGLYGTLVGDVPMTAEVKVRWSLTPL
jgi:hypothetical protein